MTSAPINSEYMPNTLTNILESIGGHPETSAATNVAKSIFSQKCIEIPVWRLAYLSLSKCPKTENPKMSDHVTSVSAGETSSDTPNDYQNIRNNAWGNSRVNGGV